MRTVDLGPNSHLVAEIDEAVVEEIRGRVPANSAVGKVEVVFTDEVRRTLDSLVAHTPDEWADGVIVTDPERLLNEGRYLRRPSTPCTWVSTCRSGAACSCCPDRPRGCSQRP